MTNRLLLVFVFVFLPLSVFPAGCGGEGRADGESCGLGLSNFSCPDSAPGPGLLLYASQVSWWGPWGFRMAVTTDRRFVGAIVEPATRQEVSTVLTHEQWDSFSDFLLARRGQLSGSYCDGCDDTGGGHIFLMDEAGRLLLRSCWEECNHNSTIGEAIGFLYQQMAELAASSGDGDTAQPDGDQAGALSCTGGVCTDPATGFEWQQAPADKLSLSDAGIYCSTLDLDGTGWRLPRLDELRTLIRGCPATEPGGGCGLTDDCLSHSCPVSYCGGCPFIQGPTDGCYWPRELGRFCTWHSFLSSSMAGINSTSVSYDSGAVWQTSDNESWQRNFIVRCVRQYIADGDGEAE